MGLEYDHWLTLGGLLSQQIAESLAFHLTSDDHCPEGPDH